LKLQCISTEIPQNYSTLLVSLVSAFLFPTGSWNLLDMMFNDSLPTTPGYPTLFDVEFDTDYYTGQIYESSFYFGQRRFGDRFPNWSTETRQAWIALETGIPHTITYSKGVPDCTASFFLHMNVTINI